VGKAKMSSPVSDDELREIRSFISVDRLGTFRRLTKSDLDAVQLYQRTMMLGAGLISVLGVIEIAIRNRVCAELENTFDTQDWLSNPPSNFAWHQSEKDAIPRARIQAQKSQYSKLDHSQKTALDAPAYPAGAPAHRKHSAAAMRRQPTIQVTNGQIVAELTMHFWKRLFSEHYERTLWKRALKRVFPNKSLTRPLIAGHLEVLYQTRNRSAHHEPIYGVRLDNALSSIDFFISNFALPFPSKESALAKLIEPNLHFLMVEVEAFKSAWKKLTK
jgi:hypothetical protein